MSKIIKAKEYMDWDKNLYKELTPLMALQNIKSLFVGSPIDLSQQFDIIETALKSYETLVEIHANTISTMKPVEKKLKALEIIKEKEISIADFVYACKCSQKN